MRTILVSSLVVSTVISGAFGAGETATGFRQEPIPVESRASFYQQKTAAHVVAEKDYYCWGMSVIRWSDGKYHAYYARWLKSTGFKGWMTDCEVAHAVADNPAGPFKYVNTVIASHHRDGWDMLTAHNPCVCVADGKICLYYISVNLRKSDFTPTEEHPYPSRQWLDKHRARIVRNRQCITVALADNPAGPFVRSKKPVVDPMDYDFFENIAVNPAVIYRDGRYLMIIKGDVLKKKRWFRIELAGESKEAAGPFVFKREPIYAEKETEDACLWFDSEDNRYHCLFHVAGTRDLGHMVSVDGMKWSKAIPFTAVKKQFKLSNGKIWKPARVERPFVLTDEKGRAAWLYTAVGDKGLSGNVCCRIRLNKEK